MPGWWRTDWSARAWKGLRKEDRFRHCSVTSCSTNSTVSWSTGDTASFVMRTTATSTSQRTRGSAGDGEHHALHHAKAQAQGQRGKECGGTTAGTQVFRVQLRGWPRHQAHDRAEIPGPVQAPHPGHHATAQWRQHHDDNG